MRVGTMLSSRWRSVPATSHETSSSPDLGPVAARDRPGDDLWEVVAHVPGQHLLPRPLEEGQRVLVGIHVGAVLVHLHGRARQAEEDAAQFVGLAAHGLRRALARDVADGADHVRRAAAPAGEQDALVRHQGPGAVAAPQAILAAERLAPEDALRQRLHGRVVVVEVDAVQPALDAARESSRGQAQHLVDPVGEGDRAGLDVPVVEHVERDVEERLQALVAGGDGRLRLGACVAG